MLTRIADTICHIQAVISAVRARNVDAAQRAIAEV